MTDKSHLTAIKRNKISAPMKWLFDSGLLPVNDKTRVLDYGCGRGFDADFFRFDKYDPHYFPNKELLTLEWDCIVCNYVLNTLPSECDRSDVLCEILAMLSPDGVGFVTVRRDIKKEGYTKKGTFQLNVKLDLPIVYEDSRFCIYRLTKKEDDFQKSFERYQGDSDGTVSVD